MRIKNTHTLFGICFSLGYIINYWHSLMISQFQPSISTSLKWPSKKTECYSWTNWTFQSDKGLLQHLLLCQQVLFRWKNVYGSFRKNIRNTKSCVQYRAIWANTLLCRWWCLEKEMYSILQKGQHRQLLQSRTRNDSFFLSDSDEW